MKPLILGELLEAQGSIDPAKRVARGEIQGSDLDRLCDVLQGDEVFSNVEAVGLVQCYDGRPRTDGKNVVCSKAAGGTESVAVGLALAGVRKGNETCDEQTGRVTHELAAEGRATGGHTANAVHGDHEKNCGCGACDRLGDGLLYVAEKHALLRAIVNSFSSRLGFEVDEAMSERLGGRAGGLIESGYAAKGGRRIVEAIAAAGGTVEELANEHLEGAAVLNFVAGESLDKARLDALFDGKLQAFGIDVAAMEQESHVVAKIAGLDEAERRELLVGMLYHNLAIAAVLCGESLRVVTRG